MYVCTICEADISKPLQQFGTFGTPVCSKCWFSWEWLCPFCNSGLVDCPECEGEGGFDDEESEYEWEECELCEGKGVVRCNFCKGEFRITIESLPRVPPQIVERINREFAQTWRAS